MELEKVRNTLLGGQYTNNAVFYDQTARQTCFKRLYTCLNKPKNAAIMKIKYQMLSSFAAFGVSLPMTCHSKGKQLRMQVNTAYCNTVIPEFSLVYQPSYQMIRS